MRIAILGGAFDPPHLGHLLLAQQTLDFANIDEVWLMPCFSHPFNKKVTSGETRLELCKLAVKDFNNKKIRVCDFEIRLKKKSFTIETVTTLKKTFKAERFYWLIGSDNLKDFKKWKDWKNLVSEVKFFVFPRIDFPVKKLPTGFKMVNTKRPIASNLSSYIIRERLKKGLSIKGLVTEGVEKEIIENKMYK